jgi:hypothetical protein
MHDVPPCSLYLLSDSFVPDTSCYCSSGGRLLAVLPALFSGSGAAGED